MDYPVNVQQHALNLGSAYVSRTIATARPGRIKRYFQIDNAYLVKKLGLILYPYAKTQWAGSTEREAHLVPITHPDLYIPLMGIITYVLCIAAELEVRNEFRPETLGKIATRAVFADILEVLLIKAGSFFFDAQEIDSLDVLSFVGYKYVPIILLRAASVILPGVLKKLLSVVALSSFCAFLGKSLKGFLITQGTALGTRKKRMYFLVLVVLVDLGIIALK